jgi:hypothetical protein
VIPHSSASYKLISTGGSLNGLFFMDGPDLCRTDNKGILMETITGFSNFKPASFSTNNNTKTFIVGIKDSLIRVYYYDGNTSNTSDFNTGKMLSSFPVLADDANNIESIFVGTQDGSVLTYKFDFVPTNQLTFSASISFDNHPIKSLITSFGYIVVLIDYQLDLQQSVPYLFVIKDNNQKSYSINEDIKQIALSKTRTGSKLIIALSANNFFLISDGTLVKKVGLSGNANSFALADLKNDGDNYIVYNLGDQIHAMNLAGAEAVNFPFTDPDGKTFTGSPRCADFEGDKKSEIISFTQDGRIVALDGGTGKLVNGFPISAGLLIESSEILDINGKTSLTVIDSLNHFYGWTIGSVAGLYYWSEEYANYQNTSSVDAASGSNFNNEFFPKNKVYNYPNPVYNGVTAIRYYVAENSKINIKIFDLVGDFVAELNDNVQGGFESETLWNLNNIQSGVYLARVEAVGESGKTESNVIKIAVVK